MPPVVELPLEYADEADFEPRVIEILNSTLPVDGAKTPDEAAAALDALFGENYVEADGADAFLWWFWYLMHDLSRQVPHKSPEAERLASTLQALRDLPTKSVKISDSWGGGTVELWQELPFFGPTYREALDQDLGARNEEERQQRFVNLQAYAARVGGLGLLKVQSWSLWALWSLVDALEGSVTPVRGAPDEINEDPAAVEDISCKVKSAAAWIIFAGDRLYKKELVARMDHPADVEEVGCPAAGPIWNLHKKELVKLNRKTKGTLDWYCPERWNLWKHRFARIRDTDKLGADVRNEAGDALAAMEAMENVHAPT